VRLLLDAAFATGTYTVPIISGWVTTPNGITVELVARLTATGVAAADVALVPSSELLALQQTHEVLPGIAVVADGAGAIAMRTPVRPDEVNATPVRLLDTSGTAEFLARATLKPFYGIEATTWGRDGDAEEAARAEVVIVEGAEALREPEGGFSEDLSRAWFILTAQPVVTHVLAAPRDLAPPHREAALSLLDAARAEGLTRRRDWRPQLADREGIARDRANEFWAKQRLYLDEADRAALLDLLRRGHPGTSRSSLANVEFRDEAG
jgi:predicted solute-binding protein